LERDTESEKKIVKYIHKFSTTMEISREGADNEARLQMSRS
jgi:hypothetical protein